MFYNSRISPSKLLLNARNRATPYNGKVTVIVMTKITSADVPGMEEIAADPREIFSIALIVHVETLNIIRRRNQNNRKKNY